jgi:ElaB/YqjD/DUF883 family membrane-anchored ribosome-binding protein
MNTSSLRDDLQASASKVEQKARQTLESAHDTALGWTQKAQGSLESLGKVATRYAAQGQEGAMQVSRSIVDKLQERPLQVLLAAAGIGFLLAIAIKRR